MWQFNVYIMYLYCLNVWNGFCHTTKPTRIVLLEKHNTRYVIDPGRSQADESVI